MMKALVICLALFNYNIDALRCYECSDFTNETAFNDCGGEENAIQFADMSEMMKLSKCDGSKGVITECKKDDNNCQQETYIGCGNRILGLFFIFDCR